ncbi:MAG: RecX family transcriptional regulator [Anaerolineales bacterium]
MTRLVLQKKNKQRVNVHLDGEFAFGLAKVLAAQLHVGDHLDAETIVELRQKDSVEEARKRALRLIARRPRSEKELRRYFDRREIPPSVQDEALDRLRRAGLVDDRAFAETWVENRMAFRPRGALALRHELRQKGVNRGAIESALENFDEEHAALKAGRKAARRYQDLSWEAFRQRVGGYLGRRGFRYSMISSVVERVWGEITEDESEVSE